MVGHSLELIHIWVQLPAWDKHDTHKRVGPQLGMKMQVYGPSTCSRG